jgi:hypothetical protein
MRVLGDEASASDLASASTVVEAIGISELALIYRTDGRWTYANLQERTVKGMLFKVSSDGSPKFFENQWFSYVRRLAQTSEDEVDTIMKEIEKSIPRQQLEEAQALDSQLIVADEEQPITEKEEAGPISTCAVIFVELQLPEQLKTNFGGHLATDDGSSDLVVLPMLANSQEFGGVDAAKRLCQNFLRLTERWSKDKPDECCMLWHYISTDSRAAFKLFEPLELLAQMVMGDPVVWYEIIIGKACSALLDGTAAVSKGAALSSSSRIRRMGFEMYHDQLASGVHQKLGRGAYVHIESAARFKELGPSDSPVPAAGAGVRVVMISDTHGYHRRLAKLPAGDLLVHAGDIGYEESRGEPELMRRRLDDAVLWLSEQTQFKYKVLVGGNHDWLIEQMQVEERQEYFARYADSGVRYLDDSMRPERLDFGGDRFLTLWGSAISLWKKRGDNKAFAVHESEKEDQPGKEETGGQWLSRSKGSIGDEKIDVLITHSPPHDCLGGSAKGCPSKIKDLVEAVKPTLYVCGHTHTVDRSDAPPSSHVQSWFDGKTTGVNAALVGGWNSLCALPMVIDVIGHATIAQGVDEVEEEQARKNAEEQAKKNAEEQARKEAEETRKEAAEEAARTAMCEDIKARKAEEEVARRKRAAEEQAAQQVEQQNRIEAAEKAKWVAEEQARQEAEERELAEAIRASAEQGGGAVLTAEQEGKLKQLTEFMGAMGFSEEDCRQGLEASEWAPEAASEWVFGNCQAGGSNEDESTGAKNPGIEVLTAEQEGKLKQLTEFMGAMGFGEEDCRRALEASGWAVDAASEWVFGNCQAGSA